MQNNRISIVSIVLLSLLAQVSWAFVSVYGGRGNYKILTARCDPIGTFGLNLYGDYFYQTYQDTFLGSTYNDHRHFGEGRANLSYTMFKFLELNGFANGFVRYDQKKDVIGLPGVSRKDAYSYGWKGFGGSAKTGMRLFRNETNFLSGYVGGRFGFETGGRVSKRDTALVNRGFPRFYGHYPDFDCRLLLGLEFGALGINANIGRIKAGRSWNSKTIREDKFVAGLSADLNINNRSSLFAEFVDYRGLEGGGDSVLGIGGVKVGLIPGMSIDLIFVKGINTDTAVWEAAGGLSFFSTLLPEVKKEKVLPTLWDASLMQRIRSRSRR